MLVCPKSTEHLHKFRQGNRMYVADLSQCLVLEIDNIVWDILDLCPSFSSEEIIETLEKKYGSESVIEALESLVTLEARGVLFSNLESHPPVLGTETPRKLKILVLARSPYAADITRAVGGVSVAHHNLVKSLGTYAFVDVVGEHDEQFNENVRGIRFQFNDKSSRLKLMKNNYDGVLLESHPAKRFLSLLHSIDAPFVVPIYSARGHNGDVINAGLLWYTAMRSFDADLYMPFWCQQTQ